MEASPASATTTGHDRDAALRAAHRRAFNKISEACATADFRPLVADAVAELVDACEDYAEAHRARRAVATIEARASATRPREWRNR